MLGGGRTWLSRHFVFKSVWDNGARTSLKLYAGMVECGTHMLGVTDVLIVVSQKGKSLNIIWVMLIIFHK